MRRTIAQIRKELDSMRHDVAVVLLFLLLPFIQIYAWTTSPSLVPYGLTVAVQDLDRTPLSQLYTEGIRALSVMRSFHWPQRYEPLLDRAEARGAVVIPENFQRDFYAGKTVEVQWVIEGTQLKAAGKVKSGAAGVTNYVMSRLRRPEDHRQSSLSALLVQSRKEGPPLLRPWSFRDWNRTLHSPHGGALFRANGPAVQRSAHLPRTLTLTNLLLERLPPIHWWGWCRRRFALPSSCRCSSSSQWDLLPFLCGTVIYTICNVTVGALIGVQVEGEVSAIGMAKTYGGVLTYVFSGHLFP